jgi:hypothetical protein
MDDALNLPNSIFYFTPSRVIFLNFLYISLLYVSKLSLLLTEEIQLSI